MNLREPYFGIRVKPFPFVYYGLNALAVTLAANAPTIEDACRFPREDFTLPVQKFAVLAALFGWLIAPLFAVERLPFVSRTFRKLERDPLMLPNGDLAIDGKVYPASDVVGRFNFRKTVPGLPARYAGAALQEVSGHVPALVLRTKAFELREPARGAPSVSFDALGSTVGAALRATLLIPPLLFLQIFLFVSRRGCALIWPLTWSGLNEFFLKILLQCAVTLFATELLARWLARERDELAARAIRHAIALKVGESPYRKDDADT